MVNFQATCLTLTVLGVVGLGGQYIMMQVCMIPERRAQQEIAEKAALMVQCANDKRAYAKLRTVPGLVMWGGVANQVCYAIVDETASSELRGRRRKQDDTGLPLTAAMSVLGTISAIVVQGASTSLMWPVVAYRKKHHERK